MEAKASTDTLTNLPNRAALYDYLQGQMQLTASASTTLTLFYIDLDNFKNVNDTYGHQTGDIIIQETGARLKSCIREGEMVARLGGDEFIMVLHTRAGEETQVATLVGARIIKLINEPFLPDKFKLHLGCSLGCAIWPKDGSTIEEILANADKALYVSKIEGKNRLNFYKDYTGTTCSLT